MSNLQINSVQPFAKYPERLPRQLQLQETFGVDNKNKPLEFNGKISKLANGLTRVQYVPSDSPYFAKSNGKSWSEFCNSVTYDPFESLYTVNEQGFRAPNFKKSDGKNAVMFLGDSFTYGIGSRDHEIFPHIVSNKLGKVNWNLGVGGISDREQLYLLDHFISLGYIPSQIVFSWGETHRKLLLNDNFSKNSIKGYIKPDAENIISEGDPKIVGRTFSPTWELSLGDYGGNTTMAKAWILTHENEMFLDLYNTRQSLQKTCKLHNIPLLEVHNNSPSAIFCYHMDGNPPWDGHHSNYYADGNKWASHWLADHNNSIEKLYMPGSTGEECMAFLDKLRKPANQGGDWARDNGHWGPITHNLIADKILTLLKIHTIKNNS